MVGGQHTLNQRIGYLNKVRSELLDYKQHTVALNVDIQALEKENRSLKGALHALPLPRGFLTLSRLLWGWTHRRTALVQVAQPRVETADETLACLAPTASRPSSSCSSPHRLAHPVAHPVSLAFVGRRASTGRLPFGRERAGVAGCSWQGFSQGWRRKR